MHAILVLFEAMAIGPLYRCFLEVARERGVDVARVLQTVGLTEQALLDPATRLLPEVGRALGGALFRAANTPSIGLDAARRFRLSDFDVFGYLMKHASDLRGILAVATQYSRLIGDSADFRVEEQRDELSVSWGRSGGRMLLHEGSDFAAGVTVLLFGQLISDQVHPHEVRLPRERPQDERPYRRFFLCKVVFGAERATLVYPASVLSLPCRHGDPKLLGILQRQAEDYVAKLPSDGSLSVRVRAYVAQHLESGVRDINEVARSLAVSERTLRRRLREAGTGYRELIDDVRRERALMLADQGFHSATEIAVMVGFEDSAAFARAFRRWTGKLPRDYLLARRQDPSALRASEQEAPLLRSVRSGR
jgi:AraC-like DNA-binding protein